MAEELRQLLLDKRDEIIQQSTELLLMFAARAQNVNHIIIPALSAGVVLADRFTDATYAYQGAGRGLSQAVIDNLVTLVHPNIEPDLTLLLDAPVEVGRQRIVIRIVSLIELSLNRFLFSSSDAI